MHRTAEYDPSLQRFELHSIAPGEYTSLLPSPKIVARATSVCLKEALPFVISCILRSD